MVYHIFGKYPHTYQPYNIRLIEGLKIELSTKVVSLNNPLKKDRDSTVMYMGGAEKRFSMMAFFESLKLKKQPLKKRYKFYLKFSYVINNPDAIFHFHNLQNINNDLLKYMIRNHIRYVISLRGYDITIFPLLSPANKDKLTKILKNSWKVHSVCQSLVNEAFLYNEGIRDKSHVIYRTPNLKDFFNFKPKQNLDLDQEINIFTLSRIHWKKCIPESLIALKRLKGMGFKLKYNIIGGYQGDEEKRLIFLIHKLGLKDDVILHGFKSENEFRYILKNMDLCWIPTVNEGLPNTLYFLLSTGIPCIASKTDGIPEVIINYHNGVLFNPYDFSELASETQKLINDNQLRLQIASNAKKTDLQSIENEVSQYIKMYNE
jgi:glycosyltransferase involved in cell wall biosynthesis